jgi:hypothetical protein
VYVVPAVVPTTTPLRYTLYPATPTLSVDAVQVSDTVVVVEPVFASPVGTEGTVVSGAGHAIVLPVVVVRDDRLPAAS